MKTKVYYDGACHLCSRETNHYRRIDKQGKLEFVDITDPKFSAAAEGLDPKRVMQVMHVRDENGKLYLGVDGFIQIWNSIPGYEKFARFAHLPVIHQLMQVGYKAFAAARPYLPKRKNKDCHDGLCDRR